MLFIIGVLIVLGSIIGGYLMEHGNLHVLFQPAEVVIIIGAAAGSLVISCPPKIMKNIVKALPTLFAGGAKKKDYIDLLMLLNVIFSKIRVDGAISIEGDIENPTKSPLFANYKSVLANHHAVAFICDNLRVFITIGMEAHEFDHLMEVDMEAHHHEELGPSQAIGKMADALPGLGIVAAVLGVVITMGKISEPPEVLGHSIGAALVGTFLGVLSCYGFVGPISQNLEHRANEANVYLAVIRTTLVSFISNSVPQIAVEAGRRAIPGKNRPSFQELEEELKKVRKK